jgi:tRNA-guanine family transglycosylase
MNGTVSLKSGKYSTDFGPIEEGCECSTCRDYTRSYVHLTVTAKDTVGCHLVSIHNLAFQLRLMRSMREAIKKDEFPVWIKKFFHDYYGGDKSKYPVWSVNALQSVGVDLTES